VETYGLSHPNPGWAKQDPDEWWSSLVKATRGALEESDVAPGRDVGSSRKVTFHPRATPNPL
jgi:sugar (pentulose or hexulose) kinase